MQRIVLVALLGLLSHTLACPGGDPGADAGGDGGADEGDDAGPDDDADGGPDDAVDGGASGPVLIASSDPANGAGAPVRSTVTVTFTASIDPGSVDRTTVRLVIFGEYCLQTEPTRLELSDDGRTLTVRHAGIADRSYRLDLDGLQAQDPTRSVPAQSVWWQTEENRTWSASFTPDGTITGATHYERNDAGRRVANRNVDGPGLDGDWGTDDDDVSSYHTIEYDAAGLRLRDVSYDDPGVDGLWATDDDVVRDYTTYDHHAGGGVTAQVGYGAPGADALWFTDDDVVDWASRYTVDDATGFCTRTADLAGPGDDGLWLTDDDEIDEHTVHTMDARFDVVAYANSVGGPGVDGVWGTQDDFYWVRSYVRDAQGALIAERSAQDPGVDGVWQTDDDEDDSYSTYDVDFYGRATEYRRHEEPGVDGVFGTTDDEIDSRYTYVFDDMTGLQLTRRAYVGPGPNLAWLDDDDEVQFYQTVLDDPRRSVWFESAGVDGDWFTADDVSSSAVHYLPGY